MNRIAFLSLLAMTTASQGEDLAPLLKPILEESKLPSLAAALVVGDEIKSAGAVGVRKLGDPAQVTVDDKYHLRTRNKNGILKSGIRRRWGHAGNPREEAMGRSDA